MEVAHHGRLRALFDGRLAAASRAFAASLSGACRTRPGVLVLGDPAHEPWHFVAHLTQEAERAGTPQVVPTWVRWSAPATAPAHLAVTVDALADLTRRHPLLVVAGADDPALLERADDVRRRGGLVLAVDAAATGELAAVADEHLAVPHGAVALDRVGHLLSGMVPAEAGHRARRVRPGTPG